MSTCSLVHWTWRRPLCSMLMSEMTGETKPLMRVCCKRPRLLRHVTWCLHAGVIAVSWQAHGGDPVLDAFWAICSGGEVAITGSLHGALCFWSAAHLLEAACLQQSNQVMIGKTCAA